MKILVMTLTTLLAVSAGTCHAEVEDSCKQVRKDKQCECYKNRAELYEDKMRKGYKANEYNDLEEKRKYFRDKAFNCKK